ncbi:unnamed protein product [Kuraishia capsulata CBS 1993]|uniref:RING-type domain-containing protein n=1 Tax=Kuraishia capsulata CBS 1993 TaxID=1382522 RepID=W6MLD7_9ASCO|nr:uncharacterized protein KUCA_T00002900001 [Kuraishia capsulata CBS 1993]CDK26923.1 unnamed protein product [Kuraishia capsulata CBS 1993]
MGQTASRTTPVAQPRFSRARRTSRAINHDDVAHSIQGANGSTRRRRRSSIFQNFIDKASDLGLAPTSKASSSKRFRRQSPPADSFVLAGEAAVPSRDRTPRFRGVVGEDDLSDVAESQPLLPRTSGNRQEMHSQGYLSDSEVATEVASPENASFGGRSIELDASTDGDYVSATRASFRSMASTFLPMPSRPPPPAPPSRESAIEDQFRTIQGSLDASLLTQFETLTGLLDVVTITTLRRLVNSDNSTFSRPHEEFDLDRDCYRGQRIDRVLDSTSEETGSSTDDVDTTDRTFSQFLVGLRSENLLARELGRTFMQVNDEQRQQSVPGLPEPASRNMSFFRAFRFDNTELIGFASTSRRFERLIPVLIVGVVGVPSGDRTQQTDENTGDAAGSPQSAAAAAAPDTAQVFSSESAFDTVLPTSSQRTWIVIVMAQYYPLNDPALQSMPEFVNILLEYAVSTDSDGFTASTDNDISRALRVRPGLPPLNRQVSELPPETEAFRESLRTLLERVRCVKHLTREELDKASDSVFKVRFAKDDTVAEFSPDDETMKVKVYDEDERCPICLTDYVENDLGRALPKCKHEFHKACIDEWLLQGDNSCPICRGKGIEVGMVI